MVIHFKTSLKQLNKEKAEKQTQRDEITELQDALVEIAGLIETMATSDSGEESANDG